MTGPADIFARVTRIEHEADALLARARADAVRIRQEAERQAAELDRRTDVEIEQAKHRLAQEHKARTDRDLAELRSHLLREKAALESVRNERFDDLVQWTAQKIRHHLLNPEAHGH